MREFFKYGYKVDGYDVRVINEREARAAAGILFAFGFLSLLNSVMLGNIVFSKWFVTIFMIDFIIRVINPKYSFSMLVGRVFIQNQIPEYVGASQKRFAWLIGVILAIPMFYYLVIDPVMNPIKIIICVICLILLISESAFSICLGCKIYNIIKKEKATNCPGGVCELQPKEPIQTFNSFQKAIVLILVLFTTVGLYNFSVNTPNYSTAMKMMPMMMMSDKDKIKMQNEAYNKQLEAEFADDHEDSEEEDDDEREEECIVPQHAIDMGHEKKWRKAHCGKDF